MKNDSCTHKRMLKMTKTQHNINKYVNHVMWTQAKDRELHWCMVNIFVSFSPESRYICEWGAGNCIGVRSYSKDNNIKKCQMGLFFCCHCTECYKKLHERYIFYYWNLCTVSSLRKVKTLVEKGAPLFDFRRMTRRAGILLGTHFILLSFFITIVIVTNCMKL